MGESAQKLINSQHFWVLEELFKTCKEIYDQSCSDFISNSTNGESDDELVDIRDKCLSQVRSCKFVMEYLEDCISTGDLSSEEYNNLESQEIGEDSDNDSIVIV
jgi:hypothetical protein